MNSYKSSFLRLKNVMHMTCLCVVASLLAACAVAKIPLAITDALCGTNMAGSKSTQVAPPPKASWTKAPDFNAEALSKIAILSQDDARGNGRDQFMFTIEDEFIKAALQKGYKVSSRSDVDRVLQEIRFQQSGLTEQDAAKLGRMLNVPAVLIVRITGAGVNSRPTGMTVNYERQYEHTAWCDMSARLISVEKAEILGLGSFSATRRTNNDRNKEVAVYLAAQVLADALPARDMSKAP